MANPFLNDVQAAYQQAISPVDVNKNDFVSQMVKNPKRFVPGQDELTNTPGFFSWRHRPKETIKDAMQAIGIEPGRGTNRTLEGIFGGTQRTSFGAADFVPGVAQALAGGRTGDALSRNAYKEAFLQSLGMVPGGLGKAPKPPVGSLETVMLQGGRRPHYGIVDRADDSLAAGFGGGVGDKRRARDFSIVVQNAVPNPAEVKALQTQINPATNKPFITMDQAADVIEGPKLPTDPDFVDQLKIRGLKPGNAIRSGAAFGNVRGIMQAARQASLSPPLRNLEGDFVGTRVTGAKRTEQRVSIPKSRQKALDRDMKPPKDLSLPNIFDIGDFSKASDVEFLRKIARRSQDFGEAKLSVGENIGRGSQNTDEFLSLYDQARSANRRINELEELISGTSDRATPDAYAQIASEITDAIIHRETLLRQLGQTNRLRADYGDSAIRIPRPGYPRGDVIDIGSGRVLERAENVNPLVDELSPTRIQYEAWDDPLQFATGEATPLSDLAPQLSDLVNASGGNFRDVVEHALPDSVDVLQAEIAFLNESFERLGTRGSSSLFGANLDNERRAINRMLDDRADRISEILDDEIPF